MKSLHFLLISFLIGVVACKKSSDTREPEPPRPTDTANTLKAAANFPIGIAINSSLFSREIAYKNIVIKEADRVTFEYQMKHGAIVKDDGSLDFNNADELVNSVNAAGLDVFGHTLGWHQNQDATYLKKYSGLVSSTSTEIIQNGGFEAGVPAAFTNWSTFNAQNGALVSVGCGTDVRTGSRSMKVVNPVANPEGEWKVQVASDLFNTIEGSQYVVTYYVKASSDGGSIRLSTQTSGGGSPQYQAAQSIGTNWTQVTWIITANSPQTRILFDMGLLANTYSIDDVSVKQITNNSSNPQVITKLEQALNNFITGSVSRYKGKVKAWDVVNELFADNGSIRNNSNTSTSASDVFVWSNYLGRDYALKAFQYAAASDPNALLFINDYNLESQPVKLDSLIAFVAELKSKGAKVDGIGTQMHITVNTSRTGIDQTMKKLAATGLKIHLSELDIRMNPTSRQGYVLTQIEANNQAELYKYVVKSYMTNIPKAQQFGITIWGVSDHNSWLYNNGLDFPLLFDANYVRKASYSGVLQALKGL